MALIHPWQRHRRDVYLRDRLKRDEKVLPVARASAMDADRDRNGVGTSSLASGLLDNAICRYLLYGDTQDFRSRLRESVLFRASFLDRYDRGDRCVETIDHRGRGPAGIGESLVSMLAAHPLFNALASGDVNMSVDYARRLGGRPEAEKAQDIEFVRCFGYALKWTVLGERKEMEDWIPKWEAVCRPRRYRNFSGYAMAMRAILEHDAKLAEEGIAGIAADHLDECEHGELFSDLDKYLCVWGVGMANLCRWNGLAVGAVPPLIPADLLVDVATRKEGT